MCAGTVPPQNGASQQKNFLIVNNHTYFALCSMYNSSRIE